MRTPLTLFATLALAAAAAGGDNWPQFRGPNAAGASDAKGLPLTWGEKHNVVWKVPIHDKGWASPVVWGDQVWLTTAKADGTALYAVCVNRGDGKVVHDVKVFTVEKPEFCIDFNSYASPTPAVEEGRVYVHFGTYGTACLDTKTGKTLWERRDLHCNHFRGPGSSPVLYRDLLIVHFDGFDAQYVVALNKKTGETVWKKDRKYDYAGVDGDHKKAYGTPAVITVGGKDQLVSSGAVGTTAYDPLTGDELWTVAHEGMNSAIPPLDGKGRVVLFPGDGRIKMLAVRPDGKGDVTKTHIDWVLSKGVPSRAGPVLVDGLLFMVNEGGVASCVDAKTGKSIWEERLGGKFSASALSAGGRVYFFDQEDGKATVIEASRTFKKLAANKLDDGCMASPAAAGKSLFIRTKTHLYRIEEAK